jgi:hypothetical protein
MMQLLTTLAIVPFENLAVLFSVVSGELKLNPQFVSLSSEPFRRLLFGHSMAVFDGVFAGFPDGLLTGYRGSQRTRLQFVNSSFEGSSIR